MAYQRRRGKLSVRLLWGFLGASLLPLFWVGWQLSEIVRRSLSREILAMQQSLAVGFADTAHKYVSTFKNVLVETASLEDFASMNQARQQQYLNRIMNTHLAILELSIVGAAGGELMRTGRFLKPNPEMRRFEGEEAFTAALQRGLFIGRLERFQGIYPTMTVAVLISDPKTSGKAAGVLMGRVSLNGLTQMLGMEFPAGGRSIAAVVAPDGFLVAHSNPKEVYRPDARLSPELVNIITTQTDERGGGELRLSDGTAFFGTYAYVAEKLLDWAVYVQQPVQYVRETSHKVYAQVLYAILVASLFALVGALVVARQITRPVRVLRDTMDRLRKAGPSPNEELPEDLLEVGHEIGDLAETFQEMHKALNEKTGQLKHANEELEKFSRHLEDRVRAKQRELKAAQDELIKNERLAAIGQMASTIGHEIRQPLSVISNSTYFIKTKLGTGAVLDPKIEKHIKYIEAEIKKANDIINEILAYARTRELKVERVALNGFLEELLGAAPIPPNIQVTRSFDPANPVVDIDPTEMSQAVRNLVGNAVEVMPNGGQLGVRSRLEAPWVVIEVSDTGGGIPPDVLDKIFIAFFTTKARGTGLGLAVVQKAMLRHRGHVRVDSLVGQGTTFRLSIPLPAAGGAGTPNAAAAPAAVSSAVPPLTAPGPARSIPPAVAGGPGAPKP